MPSRCDAPSAAHVEMYGPWYVLGGLGRVLRRSDDVPVDAFRDTPGADLLTGLRGKDVVVAFVESYGRVALEDSEVADTVLPTLDSGTRRLQSAGFSSRSGWLTAPTFGGLSWLAHSTLQSGLWVE